MIQIENSSIICSFTRINFYSHEFYFNLESSAYVMVAYGKGEMSNHLKNKAVTSFPIDFNSNFNNSSVSNQYGNYLAGAVSLKWIDYESYTYFSLSSSNESISKKAVSSSGFYIAFGLSHDTLMVIKYVRSL